MVRGRRVKWRLAMLAIVVVALTPTWLRSPTPPADYRDRMEIVPLDIDLPRELGDLELVGAWEMRSSHSQFGSYSALENLGDGTLLVGSDRGRLMRFAPPDGARTTFEFLGTRGAETKPKDYRDLESLTRDPATGTIWAGYEASNSIARLDSGFAEDRRVYPDEMRNWASNSGAETLLRLADGRFLVIAEGRPGAGDGTMPALIFAGDPTSSEETGAPTPTAFAFAPPDGFRPVDAAQLPDGRVLVLVRRVNWGLPPAFEVALVLADPADIAVDAVWRGSVVARIADPQLSDNYEGLAVVSGEDGTALWIVSDDNDSAFQRTLLIKLAVPAGL